VRRNAALGDVVSATVIADKLKEKGYHVEFQSHPSAHPVLHRAPSVGFVSQSHGYAHVDLDGAYETNASRRSLHFNDMWFSRANQNLHPYGIDLGKPFNARPRLLLSPAERAVALAKFTDYPKPWVFVCPYSQYYNVRSVPDGIWEVAAKKIKGTTFWMGLRDAPSGLVDLKLRSLNTLIPWLACADLLATVDTGPMHIAAALGVRVLAISQSSSPELHLTDQVDFDVLLPEGNLDCLNCQENVCPKSQYTPPCQNLDPDKIAEEVNDRVPGAGVSVVIPIYQPDVNMLNKCIQSVESQVDEIVLTMEQGGVVPQGTLTSPKIRNVRHPGSNIGFGRNVNFGLRHTRNPFVLILNDDVYLAPNAVDKLFDVMDTKVGIVGHLTWYPNGTIYHAGKPRAPGGGIGFPHIDHRGYIPTITEPKEMENTNGASILVRRKAFYDAGGFDERFVFYAEDDDICMRMRKSGWQVWYTPYATGIHDEHAETKKRPDMMQIMQQSNALFGQLWGEYFRHNRNNPGLGDFRYLIDSKEERG
jgi:GT2 family glycosyltransferase